MIEDKRIWNLRSIAHKRGLENADLFAQWFNKRFPKGMDETYIVEWVDRFKRGNPTVFMDDVSFKDYLDVMAQQRGLSRKKMKRLL